MTDTEPTQTPGSSILILDDDQFLLDMYVKKFTDEGYTVRSCMAVHEAIQILEHGFATDAVVFDLTMPQESGYDLLKQLKEKGLAKEAVKVVLTNLSSEEEEAKTKSLGADAYIVKATMIPSEVFNTIDGLIHERKA